MVDRFLDDRTFEIQQFVAAVKHIPQFAVWRGYMLEAMAHRTIPDAPTVSIRLLTAKPPRTAFKSITLPKCVKDTVVFKEIHLLQAIELNVYHRPANPNFPTIDSFIVMDGHALNKDKFKAGQLVLVFYQVTVSDTHVMDGPTLNKYHAAVLQLLFNGKPNASLPMVMVFVGPKPPKGIQQYQDLTSSSGKAYVNPPSLDQYAMVLGDRFESIYENWTI